MLAAEGEDARILAGGQSLVPMMNFRLARPPALVDINDCADLSTISLDGETLTVGATVRQRAAENDPLVRTHAPLLAEALANAGPATVRNRGTVCGSLANAYPLAHSPNAALALGATLRIVGPDGARTVPIDEFLVAAMVTAVEAGEILAAVSIPVLRAGERMAFAEARNHRGGAATALVSIRASLAEGRIRAARVAASGLDDHAIRLPHVEAALADGADIEAAYRADLADRPFAADDETTRHAERVVPTLIARLLARIGADTEDAR